MTSKSKVCCSVPQCTNYVGKGISMHRFPKDSKLSKQWQTALKFVKPVSKFMSVCSEHFLPSDYIKSSFTNPQRKHLKKGVIPSQKIPSDSQESTIGKRRLVRRKRQTEPSSSSRVCSYQFPDKKKENSLQLPVSGATPGTSNDSEHCVILQKDLPKDPLSFTVKEEVLDPEVFPLNDQSENDKIDYVSEAILNNEFNTTVKEEVFDRDIFPQNDQSENNEMEFLAEAILNNDFQTIHLSYPYRNISDLFGELVTSRLEKITDPMMHQNTMFEIHKILHRALTCD